jgi:protein phosphatase
MRALPFALYLDAGALVVAHAGLSEALQGRDDDRARSFALYGDTSGRVDAHGLPERRPWQRDYRGAARVVYGHTPVTEAEWVGATICLDTGCVFGGRLTALRWPERELVAVEARRQYVAPPRPLARVVS